MKSIVAELTRQAGFARMGVAGAWPVPDASRRRFERWLADGHAGDMDYLQRDPAMRFDPRRLVPDARSVIVLAASYAPVDEDGEGDLAVARYARGKDYHKVLKTMAHRVCDSLRHHWPDFTARSFVDTAPLAERSLAVLAGLGWIGRNGLLIVPGLGSYVLLTEIVCNLPLEPDAPCYDDCGTCRACLSACPTGALLDDGLIHAERCLSYLNKGGRRVPEEFHSAMGKRVFGCDACQSVCPHNVNVPPGLADLRRPTDAPRLELADVLKWSRADFDVRTRGRAFRSAGYDSFMHHAIIAAGNSRRRELRPLLEAILADRQDFAPVVRTALKNLDGGDV